MSLTVTRTPKLYIGGKFTRSESAQATTVRTAAGDFWANVPTATRKDARDAVTAARKGQAAWAAHDPALRGLVLYRLAEMMALRTHQLADELAIAGVASPLAVVNAAIDRVVWWAGWTDKLGHVFGSVNDVAGPYSSTSSPTPVGVVAAFATADPLTGVVEAVVPALAAGNAVVAVAPTAAAIPAVTFAEALATCDLPAGAANILTGDAAAIGPWLAEHADVDALDLAGVSDDLAADLGARAAGTLKRLLPGGDLPKLRALVETRTVWTTLGR